MPKTTRKPQSKQPSAKSVAVDPPKTSEELRAAATAALVDALFTADVTPAGMQAEPWKILFALTKKAFCISGGKGGRPSEGKSGAVDRLSLGLVQLKTRTSISYDVLLEALIDGVPFFELLQSLSGPKANPFFMQQLAHAAWAPGTRELYETSMQLIPKNSETDRSAFVRFRKEMASPLEMLREAESYRKNTRAAGRAQKLYAQLCDNIENSAGKLTSINTEYLPAYIDQAFEPTPQRIADVTAEYNRAKSIRDNALQLAQLHYTPRVVVDEKTGGKTPVVVVHV